MSGGATFAVVVRGLVVLVNAYVIPLLYALAFLYLMIGLVRYFFIEGGGEEGRDKGKKTIMYGLIGMVVLFGVWGLVNILLSILVGAAGAGAFPTQNTTTLPPGTTQIPGGPPVQTTY